MGLKEVLSKMKIVEFETPPGGQPAPASGASAPGGKPGKPAGPVDVAAILAGIPEPRHLDAQALAHGAAPRPAAPAAPGGGAAAPRAEAGGLEIPSFEEIYRTAGISEPSHGFSAYKVLEILSSPDFAGLDGKAKAAALA
ncbi:MAG TPA: hypothetical protein VHU81_06585, partial [Thermoanaerobaculia bacterium]|nr:hypothetical protein [Thermoanaerobaculia bacterium]